MKIRIVIDLTIPDDTKAVLYNRHRKLLANVLKAFPWPTKITTLLLPPCYREGVLGTTQVVH